MTAAEVTVNADVEKTKIKEMPTLDEATASDTRDVRIEEERQPVVAPESQQPIITTSQQEPTAAVTAPATSDTEIIREPTAEKARDVDVLAPATPEVGSSEVVEGEVVKLSAEKHSEDRLDDGTTVRKTVTTTRHVRPVTTIVRQVGGVEERVTSDDKLVGTEVDEHVLILQPGVLQLTDDQLERETQVEQLEDEVEDGTWLRRKVTTATVKPKAALTSAVPERLAVDQKVPPQLPGSVVDSQLPMHESQPGVSLRHEDVTGASHEQQSRHPARVDSERQLETETPHAVVDSDRKPESDQSKALQSKPNIIPIKLTKLEPLSTDGRGVTADADKPADVERKGPSGEGDEARPPQTRSGSPSLSVVRLTKLEPLSFERGDNGAAAAATDQRREEPAAEARDVTRAPAEPAGQEADQLQHPEATAEDMIVPVPSTSQQRARPAWLPMTATAAPLDDDLELRTDVDADEAPIQVEQIADQFAAAPSNIRPADEQEITETVATAPGSYTEFQ